MCQLAQVTYRQLDYWTRVGLIEPLVAASGSGSRRRWSADELTKVRRVRLASLLSCGTLQDALDALNDLGVELTPAAA